MSGGLPREGSNVSIRELAARHLPGILNLTESASEGLEAVPLKLLAAEMSGRRKPGWISMANRQVFGAFDAGGLLVAVGAATPGTLGSRHLGYICRVYVAEGVRGIGIGRRLCERLEGVLTECGCGRVFLYCNSTMHAMVRFWRRRGYVRAGTVGGDGDYIITLEKLLV